MRGLFTMLVILFVLLASTITARAGESETGRYQALLIGGKDGRSSAIFILDTQEGHIWTWGLAVISMNKVMERITYKGKVRPGTKMGDVIDEIVTTSIQDRKKP